MQLGPYELNQTHCAHNVDALRQLPDGCIDLTVTSPPYDNLRDYNGYTFDFEPLADELYRVTKPGGVVVWVVADATVNGSETGTSFRQALRFMECGFNLHDTMIYRANKAPRNDKRYQDCFEYMFVFSKERPKTFNGITEPSAKAGTRKTTGHREKGGEIKKRHHDRVLDRKLKPSIWYFYAGNGEGDKMAEGHPARYPEALARDHIISWSNPGDIVLDPFMGSGTTGKMAKELGRNWLGFDVSQEYVDLANRRCELGRIPLLV